MPGLLIIAHAPLASALQAVARHTFPDCASQLQVLDVEPDMSAEAVIAAAQALMERLGPEVLILTDVCGATPFNAALHLVKPQQVRLLAGVNVPMIWRSLCYANEPLDQLFERASQGGLQGVREGVKPAGMDNDNIAP